MLNDKLNSLEEQKILETRVEEKMRLQHLIDEARIEQERIEEELNRLEEQSRSEHYR